MNTKDPVNLKVANMMVNYAGGGLGAVAYVSPDQCPAGYSASFDAGRFVQLCEAAIRAIQNGDGIEAIENCGEAWFRLVSFHRG